MSVLAGRVRAQSVTGEIRIEVKDPSGGAMGASGTLESAATKSSRNFQTDSQGNYTFRGLALGRYHLHVSKERFAASLIEIDVASPAPILQIVTMTLQSSAFRLEVAGTTPLSGVELSLDQIAAPVQRASSADLEKSGALELSDFLNRRLDGVHLNEVQGNPFQPDLNYRGYTASPLLGTPQGISIYMDGVRLNQPFGDVVSWDLIPRIAISEVTLIPGSNPVFGLNTLGGALSVQTKDGAANPGTAIQLSGGSFGRKIVDLEHGSSYPNGFHWYAATNLFFEDGWRQASPSNVRQFFGKVGWNRGQSFLGLSLAYANNALIGNGMQEQHFLDRNYASIYTLPDITANRSPFLNLTGRRSSGAITLAGNAYYRYIRTNTLNGDLNSDALNQSLYQPTAAERAALAAAGYTGVPVSGATAANTPFPYWRCIGQVLLRDEPAEKCNGLINRTHSEQHNFGFSGQATWIGTWGAQSNQFTAGGGYDRSDVDFQQTSELGYLNPDRSITGLKAFGDGRTGGQVDGAPYDTRVDLTGLIHTGSFFLADTLSIGKAWNITASGRYNRTPIRNMDRITPGGGPGSLDGFHVFSRFNPALGTTYSPSSYMNAFLSFSEGSRAPTSIELGCADPAQPCKLPNALAGDPPLQQVVARTWEAGVRGKFENNWKWSASWFRAGNRNDILFVAASQNGFGYFKNFGRTRRQGAELDFNGNVWRMSFGGGYTFLDATYQTPELVDGSGNSTNEEALAGKKGFEGSIPIRPGARVPLIPRHMGKVYADIRAGSKLTLDLGLIAIGSSFARGNENNEHVADGLYYLGSGTSPGYAVLNMGGRYRFSRRMELFFQVNNVMDRRYYSGAQLGLMGFSENGNFLARPLPAVNGEFPLRHSTFLAPGAPRSAWAGMRFRF